MDQEQRKQLGEQIKEKRKAKGWSLDRLAHEAGISENTLMSIEGATKANQDAKIRKVLDVLGIPPVVGDMNKLDLTDVPADGVTFLNVAARRFRVMSDADRDRALAVMYPAFFPDLET